MRRDRWGWKVLAIASALGLLVSACGDDDGDDAATTTTETELTAYCEVATEIDESDDLPTADQIERYQAAAPEELQDASQLAGDAFVDADGDVVATFAAVAEDDVAAANNELNEFEAQHCGIEHEDPALGDEEAASGSTEVEIAASEYSFDIPEGIAAGPTALRLSNTGEEAHFMDLFQLTEGHTIDEVLQSEDPEDDGLGNHLGTSGLAAPGGDDTEYLNVDLEPGTYALVCFIPGADGTPHAFTGMAVEFAVS
jgi:hypothetical protein